MFCCCDAGEPSTQAVVVGAVSTLQDRSAAPEKAVDSGSPKVYGGDAPNRICVTIDVSTGTKVGLNVVGAGLYLKVNGIVAGGAIERWNAEHPDQKVEVGDDISEVNGVRAHAGEAKPYNHLVDALKGSQKLDLVFVRST
mmetsp:Transcript_95474/g.275061  ORF Transcript_95474/g.275061 Transcript_95474/m.275061 type:complete len:140 (-) Transcript_95474:168-587(-)